MVSTPYTVRQITPNREGAKLPRYFPHFAQPSMRRLVDLVIGCALLVITAPLMAVVAFAIRYESRGPILERRACIAPSGRRFEMLSLRGTQHQSTCLRAHLIREMTRVGQFLHYTRMQNLPQLVNVLRGEVSLSAGDNRSPSVFE